jgi:hypothetical protein
MSSYDSENDIPISNPPPPRTIRRTCLRRAQSWLRKHPEKKNKTAAIIFVDLGGLNKDPESALRKASPQFHKELPGPQLQPHYERHLRFYLQPSKAREPPSSIPEIEEEETCVY